MLADTLHVTIGAWVLFVVIVAAVVLVAYLGIRTSSSVDLVLVAGEVAVIAALAITILVRIGPAHYSAAVLSPASSPNGQLTDITNAMIYGITAFAGFEAAAALSEEARNTRRSIPASMIGVVIVTGIFYLLVILAETFGVGRHGIGGFIAAAQPAGLPDQPVLVAIGDVGTSTWWSCSPAWASSSPRSTRPSGSCSPWAATGPAGVAGPAVRPPYPGRRDRLPGRDHARARAAVDLRLRRRARLRLLAGAGGLAVVLVYLAVNIAVIRAFRTEFRDEFRLWRHLLIPAMAVVMFLFPLWGILHPHAYTLVDLLPFTALGWLCLGVIAAAVLRARRPASFEALGRVFMPADEEAGSSKDLGPGEGLVMVDVGSPP